MRNAILILPFAVIIGGPLALLAAANTAVGWAAIVVVVTIAAVIRPD